MNSIAQLFVVPALAGIRSFRINAVLQTPSFFNSRDCNAQTYLCQCLAPYVAIQ